MKREPSVWGSALAAVALGLLMGLRHARGVLDEATQRVDLLANLPRPRAADWIEPLRPATATLGRLDPLLELAALALGGWLLFQLVRVLNPGTRLRIDPGAAFKGPWYTVALDGSAVARAAVAAVVSIYLFGGFRWLWQGGTDSPPAPFAWGLTGLMFGIPRPPLPGLLLAFLSGGALAWLLWGERGLLSRRSPRSADAALSLPPTTPAAPSDTGTAESAVPAEVATPEASVRAPHPAGIVNLAARGALAGLIALPLLLPTTELGRSYLRELVGTLSVTDAQPWRLLAATQLAWPPLALLALVAVVHALGAPGRAPARRMALLLVPALLAAATAVGEAAFFQRIGRERYQLGIPLARAVPALRPIKEGRSYVLFGPDGAGYSGLVPYGSIQTFAAGHDGQQAVWEYLRRHPSGTPFTSQLFVHLFDSAAVDWDSAEILRVCLADLEGNPEQIFGQLLLEKLASCAITPENRQALDALADPARFRFEGAEAQSALAQLRRRFGAGATAAAAADDRDAPLRDGSVSGTVLFGGRPLPGLRVGLVPARQARTLPGLPRPYEHRHIAVATTADAAGHFQLSHAGEGDYLLIVMANDRDLPLRTRTVSVAHAPRVIPLDAGTPRHDVGTIDVTPPPTPPGGRNPALPGQPRMN